MLEAGAAFQCVHLYSWLCILSSPWAADFTSGECMQLGEVCKRLRESWQADQYEGVAAQRITWYTASLWVVLGARWYQWVTMHRLNVIEVTWPDVYGYVVCVSGTVYTYGNESCDSTQWNAAVKMSLEIWAVDFSKYVCFKKSVWRSNMKCLFLSLQLSVKRT